MYNYNAFFLHYDIFSDSLLWLVRCHKLCCKATLRVMMFAYQRGSETFVTRLVHWAGGVDRVCGLSHKGLGLEMMINEKAHHIIGITPQPLSQHCSCILLWFLLFIWYMHRYILAKPVAMMDAVLLAEGHVQRYTKLTMQFQSKKTNSKQFFGIRSLMLNRYAKYDRRKDCRSTLCYVEADNRQNGFGVLSSSPQPLSMPPKLPHPTTPSSSPPSYSDYSPRPSE